MKMILPQLCQDCHQSSHSTIVKDCQFCNDLQIPEKILCDLLRNAHGKSDSFECHAFRPRLSVVGHEIVKEMKLEPNNVGQAQRSQWFGAFATQQLKINPDQVYFDLKYHLSFSTFKREKLFSKLSVDKVLECIQQIELPFKNTQIHLLWLAKDHIHLYLDSSPDYSLEEVVNTFITDLHQQIVTNFPELQNRSWLWETDYFLESIG